MEAIAKTQVSLQYTAKEKHFPKSMQFPCRHLVYENTNGQKYALLYLNLQFQKGNWYPHYLFCLLEKEKKKAYTFNSKNKKKSSVDNKKEYEHQFPLKKIGLIYKSVDMGTQNKPSYQ